MIHTRAINKGHMAMTALIRKKMKSSIKQVKLSAWKKLCQKVDNNIWGQGYTIVLKCIF